MSPVALAVLLSAGLGQAGPRLTVDDCVARAVRDSGQVAEARGKVAEWSARLAEVESVFYPKLSGLALAAPMFTVEGTALTEDVVRRWKSPGDWGPYLRVEAVLAQPLFTFGRAAAGEKAAQERLEVERARLEQVRNLVALEVRRFYFLHLWTRSLAPVLESARKSLDEAEAKARELYEEGTGKVTNVDLMKLRYASTELDKFRIQAEVGQALSLAALKHTLGMKDSEPLELADESLPSPPPEPPELAEAVRRALEKRPEFAQLRHGQQAALSLEDAERMADLPVLAVAGQIAASWTPTRQDARNPYLNDPYNDLFGGVGLALQFEVDPARSRARSQAAAAMGEQVEGLRRLADTGIPLEVRKARDEEVQARRLLAVADEGVKATRKWMVFAGAAYASGTGETRDLLEGVASYLSAKKGSLDALLAVHNARAQLLYATGEGPGAVSAAE